jgi:hypothetical protein
MKKVLILNLIITSKMGGLYFNFSCPSRCSKGHLEV